MKLEHVPQFAAVEPCYALQGTAVPTQSQHRVSFNLLASQESAVAAVVRLPG